MRTYSIAILVVNQCRSIIFDENDGQRRLMIFTSFFRFESISIDKKNVMVFFFASFLAYFATHVAITRCTLHNSTQTGAVFSV
jgi:hypothetical protein